MLKRPGVGVYLIAGWPDPDTYTKAVEAIGAVADFFELGVPSRNPKYDGPYIRKAHREVERPIYKAPACPTYLMAYWEEHREDPERLFGLAAEIGARGVLAPDLLVDYPDDLSRYAKLSERYGTAPAYFMPGKFPHRLAERLAAAQPDFIYLGLYAATGIELPIYVERNIKTLRSLAPHVYIVAGFAIDTPQKARRIVNAGADAVVIGTAYMKKLRVGVDEATQYIKYIKQALK